MARELALHDAVRALGRMGLLRSAHDCSEGGLAVALAESCVSGADRLGAQIILDAFGPRADVALFNESQSRVVISVTSGNAAAVIALLAWRDVPARKLGTVGGTQLAIEADAARFAWPVGDLHHAWHDSIGDCMGAL